MKNDATQTRCPHCGLLDNGMSPEYRCRVREIQISGYALEKATDPFFIKAIEIYCANCNTTLSVTPYPDSFLLVLPNGS